MTVNWRRHFELRLLDDSGQGISLTDFKVTFAIDWFNSMWPRVATLKIYNLNRDTMSRITGSEFSRITIIAGYDGLAPPVSESQVGQVTDVSPDQVGQTRGQNFGEIFNGEIRFTITGRDNPTDIFTLIQSIDGHRAFNEAVSSGSLSAGYKLSDVHSVLMRDFSPFGITRGVTGEFPDRVMPRGRVFYGMTRDYMSNLAAQCNANWQFVDGQAQMVPEDKYLHEAIVLNSNTGLIGMPQQTMGAGVNVRCLINPNIRVNGLIQLDQASVYRTQLPNDEIQRSQARITESSNNGNLSLGGTIAQPASVATDGVYIVQSISYTGDTRGNPWYMDLMCMARGARDLQSNSALQRTAPQ
ncbi:hypothetical protein [Escherichia coli]|uniref:hypothetical protein n=1 Tax=Escherichia coli TaxID=562 RepID=UPI000B7AF578|nr:hypothetical protein [Escherichia coli]OXL04254.1 hypothetical protein CD806_02585 [Escherichia coli]HAJ8823712.1 hypothetical protein [Escherichia coli]